jgi:hypothetical protein
MADTTTPEQRQARSQKARRTQLMGQGYSSDCAHAMHERCKLEACTCRCHRGGLKTEKAPTRPEIKTAPRPAVSAAKARQLKGEFSLVLWLADQGVAKGWPRYWVTPDDRLQDDERTALVNATYAELEARFPKALEWLAKASESATEAMLLYTLAMIAAPRLARHGVISAELATAIVFAPVAFASSGQAEQQSAAGVEPERAPNRGGPNGHGEIDTGGAFTESSPLQDSAPIEAGPRDISDLAHDQNGAGNGRYPL